MTKYAVYCPECEELWENTFDDINEAFEALKEWSMNDMPELERFQIVEIKPVAEPKLKIELKYLD